MIPILEVYYDDGEYLSMCRGCQVQCEKFANGMLASVRNLPCGSLTGIGRTFEKIEEECDEQAD